MVSTFDLLEFINPSRFEDEESWINIGKALRALSGNNGLGWWRDATYKSVRGPMDFLVKYEGDLINVTQDMYKTFPKGAHNVKYLGWYAREDNPVKYREWHREWVLENFDNPSAVDVYSVAKASSRAFWLETVYSTKGWYVFHQNHWVLESNISYLLFNIPEYLKDYNFIEKLKSISYRYQLMCEMRVHLCHPDFNLCLDSNPNKIGVKNGVLILGPKKITFREGRPSDLISKSLGVKYENYPLYHPLVQENLKWLKQIFVEDETVNRFLRFLVLLLKEKPSFVTIFSGNGSNSKSTLLWMIRTILGGYGDRVPVVPECEEGEPFDKNKVVIYMTNDVTELYEPDVQEFHFLGRWVDQKDIPQCGDYVADPNFFSRLFILAPAMLQLMVEYYPDYLRDGAMSDNFYLSFVDACLKPSPHKIIELDCMIRFFRKWLRNQEYTFDLTDLMIQRGLNRALNLPLSNNWWSYST